MAEYIISSGDLESGIILEKDSMTVLDGGVATDTTVNDDGNLHVSSGGTANSTTVNSGSWMYVSRGGTANCTTVNSDGNLYVCNGGSATEIVENGGYVYVEDWANAVFAPNTFSGLVLSNAFATVHSGTTANSTTVNSGGRLFVYSGGSATEIVENGGYVYVEDGANAVFAPNSFSGLVLSRASATVHSGTTANSTTVNTNGSLYVESGGTATDTTVNEFGYLVVSSGGSANGTMINEGRLYVDSSGTADNTTVNFGGRLYVSSGGTANSTTVNSQGSLKVESGGTATITFNPWQGDIVSSIGAEITYLERDANVYWTEKIGVKNAVIVTSKANVVESLSFASGCSAIIYSGGTANSTTVNTRGYLYISSGGTANSTTVNKGGFLTVSSGGTANDTTVNEGGGLYVYSSGKVTGRMMFESGARVSMYEGAILDFDLTEVEAGEMALVNNLSIIQGKGTPIYTLTVNDDWKAGSYVYSLADGAQNFASTISVMNAAGDELGVLTVGETVKIGYDDYTLNLNEGALTVTVDVPDLPPTAPDGLQAIVSDRTVALLWNMSTDEETGVKEYVVTYSLEGQEYTARTQNTHYVLNGADYGTWSWSVRAVDFAGNESGISVGEAFTVCNFEPYIVEYSPDSFEHVLRLKVSSAALDSFRLPTGTYEWRMRSESVSDWQTGDPIVSVADSAPTFVQSDADGADDLFFANACGVWEAGYFAQHVGSVDDWGGTQEYAAISGKNKLADFFEGSDDLSILYLTDDANGDGLFVDDIYTELPGTLEEQQARIAQISDIRGGAGDDIVDMTSQRFEYIGDGISLHGGDGNDVLWANKGENWLFGDLGDDRLVGASDDDLLVGGAGDDRMHGGGGNDFFTFCEDWGKDTVEHLATGSVTLWFASGELANWDADSLTYTDGENKVTVKGVTAEQIELKFGDDGSEMFAWLSDLDAFEAYASRKIFEEAATGALA